jgi:hypothetical protein
MRRQDLELQDPELQDLELKVAAAQRRRDVRIMVNIAGRFCLSSRWSARRVFACRAVNLSPRAVALATVVIGEPGEPVVAHIDHLGKMQGTITRALKRGFVMSISATDAERERLIDKIEWLEKHKNHDVTDKRAKERFVPANPYSRMILADGSCESCLVLDISASGAAVSANTVPNIGTLLAIGTVIGRVVRHFEGGFAVQFIQPQDRDAVEALVIRE